MMQFIFVGRKETTTGTEKTCSEPNMRNGNLIGIMGMAYTTKKMSANGHVDSGGL